ncbi:MAG: hypothetical protein RLZZ436_237 [Planctomycetota bacterium]|jgi:arylsulfatase A-like enzyme
MRSAPLPSGLLQTATACVAAVCLLHSASLSADSPRPNIVLVMADDQGWGDTGYNGHPQLKTPNLDAMAAAGLQLNRFYTAHFNCSPTRASIMTGRHPHRMGTFAPGRPIRPQELTVAQVLRQAGYTTGHFGKWHLNGRNGERDTKTPPGRAILASDPLSPGKLGFDEWVSADNFFDLDPVLGRNGVPEKFHGDGSDVSMDEALKFIRRQAEKQQPFLAVVWFGNPHVPHEALPADKQPYADLPADLQNYYGEITGIDRNLGKLRAALQELQLTENTLLWYCSDNGGAAGPRSTGNLRGSKGTLWDGGLRVPGLIEWPARIRQPAVSNLPCSTLDIYPTVLAAAGVTAEHQIEPLDGISLLPLLDGRMSSRDKPIPFVAQITTPGSHAALLDWPWKLHTDPSAGNGRGKKKVVSGEVQPVMLFNVETDPRESRNLADEEPERVASMRSALEDWKQSVRRSLDGADYPAGAANQATPPTPQ